MPYRARPRFDVAPGATLTLGEDVTFGRGCRVHVTGAGELVIGAGTHFDEWCVLGVHERVEIGADCRFGEGATVLDFEPGFADPERPTRLQGLRTAPVRIGDRCTIGTGAVLLPGAEVPDDGTVGAKVTIPAG